MSTFFSRSGRIFATLALGLGVLLVAVDHADARRISPGGGFGSRGERTYQSPPATPTAPGTAAPIDRSMTPRSQAAQPAQAQPAPGMQAPARGRFGGFGGIFGGLMLGGLVGMLLGNGIGGAAGLVGLVLQIGLVVLAVMAFRRFFGRGTAYAGAAAPSMQRPASGGLAAGLANFRPAPQPGASTPRSSGDEIGIGRSDLDAFERLLGEIQAAYGAEDFARLRARTTPEVMSYFAEELGQNATQGVKNEVSDVRLLQGDLAESWREGDTDYATVAMRYSSVDATRDRETGRIVEGDAEKPTETAEIWTFARRNRADWKLSAVQAAA
ncbi:putative lipid-binding transport protein (Tim44 family) [Inquilinus ginsengisoli]|uniref:Lipid-binding transport protein (Tim44 family) n=1 Tax=Inquilinus ginsengisoli TaxID=363840 RepID=A0ABU1JHJ2_9PROT|nr:Tim44 domain-containing protein [Inquilinus ginsengisoli]MDR6288092.1 putative lipid-binding transport protein (Tim44 family) [Inquilinus ginsengisoli]